MARISAFGKHSTSLHVPPGRPLVSHSSQIPLSGTLGPITLLLPLPHPLSPRTQIPALSVEVGNNRPSCTSLWHASCLPALRFRPCSLGWETTNQPATTSGATHRFPWPEFRPLGNTRPRCTFLQAIFLFPTPAEFPCREPWSRLLYSCPWCRSGAPYLTALGLRPPFHTGCPASRQERVRWGGGGKQPTLLQWPQARPTVSHGSNFGLWETRDPAARSSRPSSCFPLLPNS